MRDDDDVEPTAKILYAFKRWLKEHGYKVVGDWKGLKKEDRYLKNRNDRWVPLFIILTVRGAV